MSILENFEKTFVQIGIIRLQINYKIQAKSKTDLKEDWVDFKDQIN